MWGLHFSCGAIKMIKMNNIIQDDDWSVQTLRVKSRIFTHRNVTESQTSQRRSELQLWHISRTIKHTSYMFIQRAPTFSHSRSEEVRHLYSPTHALLSVQEVQKWEAAEMWPDRSDGISEKPTGCWVPDSPVSQVVWELKQCCVCIRVAERGTGLHLIVSQAVREPLDPHPDATVEFPLLFPGWSRGQMVTVRLW